ncbi:MULTISPECIES: dTDP-4-dehydrorhamnose 3,5-epimerase [Thermodesulfovibrio]|uniref:dTDP-4-dehydrorhamnose 3,5-epimerase n=1 Tax=Thermodesulfovibrio yellowstonii TaxID=28262 RepID=UPI00040FAAA9|nr:dTDP-4-dehydrorhamnose 3,5-epimerase [Thermodesulfovibrio islandicus]
MEAEVRQSKISGCFEIIPKVFKDKRGIFVKVFNYSFYKHKGFEMDFKEQFYSVSHKGVIRGLHFQVPPKDHDKVIYCPYGRVFDVVVDLRVGSPTYGQFDVFELSDEKANLVYIPKGLAHGFCTLSETAILVYILTTEYSPEHDSGILWNSLNIPWPISGDEAIISERDSKFLPFESFKSPFTYKEGIGNV